MKRDHFGFLLFLVLLLMAPQIPVGFLGVSIEATLSAGFIGLLIWALIAPEHIFRNRSVRGLGVSLFILAFALQGFVVSLLQTGFVELAYASQFLFYVLFGMFLLGAYFSRAIKRGELEVTLGILRVIGLIFSLGVIVSAWTGPLWGFQDHLTPNRLELGPEGNSGFAPMVDQGLLRAVGFLENPNHAGAMLVVFASLFIFWRPQRYPGVRWVVVSVILLALLLTVSRSAMVAFAASLLLLLALYAVRTLTFTGITRRFLVTTWLFILFGIFTIGSVILASNGLLSGSVGESEFVRTLSTAGSSIVTRVNYWGAGLGNWLDRGVLEMLMGQGFFGSHGISYGQWVTPHNAYIAILGDFGLIGLVLFLVPMVNLAMRLAKWIVTVQPSSIPLFSFVSLMSVLVHNLTGVFFYSPEVISMTILVVTLCSLYFAKESSGHRVG